MNLEVTEEEINALAQILVSVGGDPDGSRRRHADSLLEKVRDLGATNFYHGDPQRDTEGTIYFLGPDRKRPVGF